MDKDAKIILIWASVIVGIGIASGLFFTVEDGGSRCALCGYHERRVSHYVYAVLPIPGYRVLNPGDPNCQHQMRGYSY